MKRFDFVGEVIRPMTPQACSSEVRGLCREILKFKNIYVCTKYYLYPQMFFTVSNSFWQMDMGATYSADDKIKDPNYFVYQFSQNMFLRCFSKITD